jgi:hypothetical protein
MAETPKNHGVIGRMPRKENENLSELASEIVDQYAELLLSSIESILAEHRETMEEVLGSATRARRVPVPLEHAITEAVRSDWHTAIDEVRGDEEDEDDDAEESEDGEEDFGDDGEEFSEDDGDSEDEEY